MSTQKNILVVQNPTAGKRKLRYVDDVVAELEKLGAKVERYFTKAANDATVYLESLTETYDLIAIAGGDGTINEAVNGLKNNSTQIGVIPVGTTNVFAKELGLPTNAKKVAKKLVAGITKDVYLARANGQRFIAFAGFGYDAWVIRDVNLDIKERFGKLAYILSMFKAVRHYGSRNFKVEIDGSHYTAKSIIIVNGRLYGGQFIISKNSDLSKDEVQVMMFSVPDRVRLIGYLFSLPFGITESLQYVKSISGKNIKISADEEHLMQMDGDIGCQLPVEIQVESQAVKFIV